MTNIIRRRNGTFTVIPNAPINDERLTMEALGLLTWLLSKPDNWKVIQSHISVVFKVGKEKTYRVLKELIECGYLVRETNRDEKGGFAGITYIIFDNPPFPEKPDTGLPLAAEPPLVRTERKQVLKAEESNQGFEQFWQLYPNKTAKAYCEKLFAKLSKPDQQSVIASMPKFLDDLAVKRKTFKDYQPPNPSTYINQRRFDDFKTEPVDWNKIMVAARRLNAWSTKDWGPSPNNPDCRVPKEFITEQDRRAWLEWKTA